MFNKKCLKVNFLLGGSFFIQSTSCQAGGEKKSVYFSNEKHKTSILSVS